MRPNVRRAGSPLATVAGVFCLVGAGVFVVAQSAFSSPGAVQSAAAGTTGQTRTYYIAADEVPWNFVPSGKNLITGRSLGPPEDTWTKRGPDRVGHVYLKALYREYTDSTFTHRKQRGPRWQHLGILGPVIHAEVGDRIRVVFKNNLPFPASIHPMVSSTGRQPRGPRTRTAPAGPVRRTTRSSPGTRSRTAGPCLRERAPDRWTAVR